MKKEVQCPVIVGQIEQRPVARLIPCAYNARTHSRFQIEQIAASIQAFGFVNPILIGPDDVIIAGHARLDAVRQLGLAEVPVIVLAHLTPAQRRALVIADNKLGLNAGWDEELLRTELGGLGGGGRSRAARIRQCRIKVVAYRRGGRAGRDRSRRYTG